MYKATKTTLELHRGEDACEGFLLFSENPFPHMGNASDGSAATLVLTQTKGPIAPPTVLQLVSKELVHQQDYNRRSTFLRISPESKRLIEVLCSKAETKGIPSIDAIYSLRINGMDSDLIFTVKYQKVSRPVMWVSPSTPNIELFFENIPENTKVFLSAGEYTFNRTIRIKDGIEFIGNGAAVFKTSIPLTNGGSYDQLIFYPEPQNTIFRGITFIVPGNVTYGGESAKRAGGIHFDTCTFLPARRFFTQYAGVGIQGPNCTFHDCRFRRVALVVPSYTMVYNCVFEGLAGPAGENHALTFYQSTCSAVVCTRFDGTDRGPLFRNDSSWNYMGGIELLNINKVHNGNEIILFEKTGNTISTFEFNIFYQFRVYNCEGPINLWQRVLFCVFSDFVLDNSVRIILFGLEEQKGNLFENIEFRGGGFIFMGGAVNNEIRNIAFVTFQNTRNNQDGVWNMLYDALVPKPKWFPYPAPSGPIHCQSSSNVPKMTGVLLYGVPEPAKAIPSFFAKDQ